MNPLPLNESSPTKRSSVIDCIGFSSEIQIITSVIWQPKHCLAHRILNCLEIIDIGS